MWDCRSTALRLGGPQAFRHVYSRTTGMLLLDHKGNNLKAQGYKVDTTVVEVLI